MTVTFKWRWNLEINVKNMNSQIAKESIQPCHTLYKSNWSSPEVTLSKFIYTIKNLKQLFSKRNTLDNIAIK
jgi:hypothetical protein